MMALIDEHSIDYKIGKIVGFILSYSIFTTILFFLLSNTQKIPESWSIVHVIALTFFITLLGSGIKRLLR
ncbi:MAG TPA: hypothetical protein VJI75_04200 [Candidatus Nanoarchaeia archaeon]|nr:hypothetical protein [Candidatus Nanoarchaeia archaeon]